MKADREGGQPLELSVKKLDVNGFVGRQEWGSVKFIAPCTYCMYADDDPVDVQGNGSAKSTGTDEVKGHYFCILKLINEYLKIFLIVNYFIHRH